MKKNSIGVDIVDVKDLKEKIYNSNLFLSKILTEEEMGNLKNETIAGKIAAKEAIIKTGFIKPGQWKEVIISSNKQNAPLVLDKYGRQIDNLKISITHTNKLAIAIAFYEKA